MGKTNRHIPRDGGFKRLKASKKQRNKKQRAAEQRATKADLQKHLQFASKHRANRNLTQLNASMYMDKSTEADFDPSTFRNNKTPMLISVWGVEANEQNKTQKRR